MKILFLHGLNSTHGGIKPTVLHSHGHTVLNPALPDDDFGAALPRPVSTGTSPPWSSDHRGEWITHLRNATVTVYTPFNQLAAASRQS